VALTPDQVAFLVGTAGRAPSVHDTQPWQFRVHEKGVDLYADRGRRLRAIDPQGREMLISCGAALFGLRLGLRHLRRHAVVELLPEPGRPRLLARVRLDEEVPPGPGAGELPAEVPPQPSQAGGFSPEPIPAGLIPGLQHDAIAEGATLVLVDEPCRGRLRDLVDAAARWQERNPMVRDELRNWARGHGRDGAPGPRYTALPGGEAEPEAGWDGPLTMRDPGPGRDEGQPAAGGPRPSATAILVTAGDTPAQWLRAGQALHRVLVHAASTWVFAALNSQPMESPPLRSLVRSRLFLPGAPQLLLEFGRVRGGAATARRPVEDLIL